MKEQKYEISYQVGNWYVFFGETVICMCLKKGMAVKITRLLNEEK